MQPIEGVTLEALWTTLGTLVAMGGIIVLWDKVKDVFKKRKKEKAEEAAASDVTINDRLDKISAKLDQIDEFVRESNERFARDNRRLNVLEKQAEDTHAGIAALCRSSLAHINHDLTGNGVETLRKAQEEINEYLTGR